MFAVFRKTLRDKRWFILGWSLGFVFLSLLMVLFYPAMHQTDIMAAFSQDMPDAFKGLMGDITDLQQFSTYLASQLFDIRGSIFAGVLSIILGLSLTVGDEEKGYLRTLLSLPLSRTKIVLQKWFAMLVIMAIVVAVMLLTIVVAASFIHEEVAFDWLVRLGVMQWLVMAACGSVVFAAGLATGRRSAALALGIVLVAGSFILSTFSTSVDWLEPYEFLSFYHYFPAVEIVKSGIELSDVLVLSGIIFVPLAASWLIFRQRDVQG